MATSTIPMTDKSWTDVSSLVTIGGAWSNVSKGVYKSGNIVVFSISGYCSSYIANNMYTFATLNDSIKPSGTFDFVGHRGDASFNLQGFHEIHVNPNGTIQVNASSTAGSWWYVNGWYTV